MFTRDIAQGQVPCLSKSEEALEGEVWDSDTGDVGGDVGGDVEGII